MVMARIGPTFGTRFGIASIEDRVKIVVGALEGSRFLETPMSTLFQRPTPVGEIARKVYRPTRGACDISALFVLMRGAAGTALQ
jgi:hypothetical protein